jgi:ABC-type transporter Mla subunit MlaD
VNVKQKGLNTDALIQINRTYAPIPADTRAILRQKTLLGETFVALSPGSRGAPKLADGAMLPTRQVLPTQQLDQVLGSFDPKTQANLKEFLNGTFTALNGAGTDLNAALGNADTSLTTLASVVTILNAQQSAVRSLIRDTGSVFQTLGARQGDLQTLVTAGDQVLSATAARNRELTATVNGLPALLSELRATLGTLDRTGGLAAPTFSALRPVAPSIPRTLADLLALQPGLQALLREAGGPLLRASKTALPAVTRLTKGVQVLSDVLEPAGNEITPMVNFIGRSAKEIAATLANVAAATQATAIGGSGRTIHYLRSLVPFTNESIFGYAQRLASNRHNAYLAPGGLSELVQGGLQAQDCRNASNPQSVPIIGTGAPPCRPAPANVYNGVTGYYPHVTAAHR